VKGRTRRKRRKVVGAKEEGILASFEQREELRVVVR